MFATELGGGRSPRYHTYYVFRFDRSAHPTSAVNPASVPILHPGGTNSVVTVRQKKKNANGSRFGANQALTYPGFEGTTNTPAKNRNYEKYYNINIRH